MMLPSSECADDIWLAGKDVADIEPRVRAIKEKGYKTAGFRLQGVKCESVITQKPIVVGQTETKDLTDNQYMYMCSVGVVGPQVGRRRTCKKEGKGSGGTVQ